MPSLEVPPRNVLNTVGTAYMGDVLRQALQTAQEMHICVAFLRFSGLNLFLDDLRRFVERGGRLKVIVSTYLNVTQPEALRVLTEIPRTEVRLQLGPQGFHAKYYMFQESQGQRVCWVGSSNFTKNGLFTSLEWNTCHDDPETVGGCEALFEALWTRADVTAATPEVIGRYAAQYQASLPQGSAQVKELVPTPLNPNPAQQEALRALRRLRAEGGRKAAVIAATGLGKTYLAAFDAAALQEELPAGQSLSVLFVAHHEEILVQAQATYARVHPEQPSGLLASGRRPGDAPFVFATIQSLNNQPELLLRPFDYIVIDEFHHAAAPSYQRVLDALNYRFLLGLTATPERVDGYDVLKACDYNVAYEVRLPEAIDQGWLIPFHYFGVADNVDYSQLKWRGTQFDAEELETALMRGERTELILRHALEKGYDGARRATVGFCAGVHHAQYMARELALRGQCTACVTGETAPEERRRIYQRFADPHDPLEWLFVADVLNEGVDIPAINSLLFLRPTQSPGLFLQQLGRGLRHYPGTEVLTILDFVGHHQNALMPLQALNSASMGIMGNQMSTGSLTLTPPRHCEIVLDDHTQQVLLKVQQLLPNKTSRQAYAQAYEQVRTELGVRPGIMNFWGRSDVPEFRELRRAFGSWIDCRMAMKDADSWEEDVRQDAAAWALLRAAETNLQLQRVGAYAALWALAMFPEEPEHGVPAFFDRFPQWNVERQLVWAEVLKTLGKKGAFKTLLEGGRLTPGLRKRLQADPRLAQEVEARLEYTLAHDHTDRHRGVLRTPADLVVYHSYRRGEIVNHLGVQFDPARHNTGVVRVGSHIALLTQLDTRDAKTSHQYENHFTPDLRHFSWQSQNQQSPERGPGQDIVDHQQRGIGLHLFAQGGRESRYVYLGSVTPVQVEGSQPFTALLKLPEPLPLALQVKWAVVAP